MDARVTHAAALVLGAVLTAGIYEVGGAIQDARVALGMAEPEGAAVAPRDGLIATPREEPSTRDLRQELGVASLDELRARGGDKAAASKKGKDKPKTKDKTKDKAKDKQRDAEGGLTAEALLVRKEARAEQRATLSQDELDARREARIEKRENMTPEELERLEARKAERKAKLGDELE